MSKGTYPLKLPASIKAAAVRLAKEDGVSLNQWIAPAVAQKIGVVVPMISSASWPKCRMYRPIQRTQSRPTWRTICCA
jgi:hypothetical protein